MDLKKRIRLYVASAAVVVAAAIGGIKYYELSSRYHNADRESAMMQEYNPHNPNRSFSVDGSTDNMKEEASALESKVNPSEGVSNVVVYPVPAQPVNYEKVIAIPQIEVVPAPPPLPSSQPERNMHHERDFYREPGCTQVHEMMR